MNIRKQNAGITLIALIITIIILLILAGISISLLVGENGILKKAYLAKEEHQKGVEKEEKNLDDLYSSIKVAGDSKVTLTMEELDKYIEKKIQEQSFTGTELLKEMAIIETSPTFEFKNQEIQLENSVNDYKFLLFTFGNYYENKIGFINTLLIPVNIIEYSDNPQQEDFLLSSTEGPHFSAVSINFENDKTIRVAYSATSNTSRPYFAIQSIQGIK
ncbi:MAG: hypothetical protein HFJ36_06260 [Clostridia bacterium]|nr:hypothetical protein [Clostridia bacterium]